MFLCVFLLEVEHMAGGEQKKGGGEQKKAGGGTFSFWGLFWLDFYY